MTTQHKNFKNISDGSGNHALPMYIPLKIPKTRETVPLTNELVRLIYLLYYTAKKSIHKFF